MQRTLLCRRIHRVVGGATGAGVVDTMPRSALCIMNMLSGGPVNVKNANAAAVEPLLDAEGVVQEVMRVEAELSGGLKEATRLFAASLQHFRVGATAANASTARIHGRQELFPDLLVAFGGDGTMSYLANMMHALDDGPSATPESAAAASVFDTPIFCLPCGLTNSLALGRCISHVISREQVTQRWTNRAVTRSPTWRVTVRDPSGALVLQTYSVCGVGFGLFAHGTIKAQQYALLSVQYPGLPSLANPAEFGLLRELIRMTPERVRLCVERHGEDPSGASTWEGDLALGVLSALPCQGPNLKLTPQSSDGCGFTATTVDGSGGRLRMAHLLLREARNGNLLEEDGVQVARGAAAVSVTNCQPHDTPMVVTVDGEPMRLPPGYTLRMEPSGRSLLLWC